MKNYAFFLSFLLIIAIGKLSAQEVILNEIEIGEDVCPTVVYANTDFDPIAKIASSHVKSRTRSEVDFKYQNVVYIVEYVNKEYVVGSFHYDDNEDGSKVDHAGLSVGDKPAFRSTKVSEVRSWLRDELIAFYWNEKSTW